MVLIMAAYGHKCEGAEKNMKFLSENGVIGPGGRNIHPVTFAK
ncbi:hypothetical protein yinte0001_20 [Yersinia intermedia ATCC 29909]|nr:hypothetical protein yinte0001_20 [Yersinia intermedia ATCC 29909]